MKTTAEEIEKARNKGLLLLGYGAISADAMRKKLSQKGFSDEALDAAVVYLEEKGYIDERRDALRLCESLIKKKYGRRRILSSVRAKGYGESALRAADEYLDTLDFTELCAMAIRAKFKYLPSDRNEMQKALAKLVALGYNVNEAKNAMRLLMRAEGE